MCKKLVYCACFCLFLAIAASAQETNLVAHWKFDDGSGNIAIDSAGNFDGTLRGGPTWIDGIVDGALRFDGMDDCVEVGSYPELNTPEGSFSVALWANITGWTGEWINSMIGVRSDGEGWCLRRFGGWWATQYPDRYTQPTTVLCFTTRGIGHTVDGVEDTPSNTAPQLNEWIHIACVYNSEDDKKYIYFDGVEDAIWGTSPMGTLTPAVQSFYIGARSNSANTGPEALFNGMLDDVRFYDRAITAQEVATLAVPPITFKAKEPIPADGAVMVSSTLFQWTPADVAAFHNVYLGTTPTLGTSELVSEQQTGSTYEYTAGFMPNITYYWRIDTIEADGITIHTGEVWSFTSGPATAFYPDPKDGNRWVLIDAELSWTAGVGAVTHDVYFGTNQANVAAGTGDTFIVNQTDTTYDPGLLENNTVYYWRIDEVGLDSTTKHTGELWRFKTVPDIQINDPDLVGWWTLDEGQGTVAFDWSGYDNNGTIMGDPQWVSGYFGSALDFDGYGDYVDCGNSPTLTIRGNITMAVWIKIAAFTRDWEAIIAKGDNAYRLSRSATTGNAVHMGINGTSANWFDGNKIVTDDEWHHIAGVYNLTGRRASLYVDGTLDESNPCMGQINETDDSFYIGENSGAGGRFFGGLIDDVRIYSRAMTLDEIEQIMQGDITKAKNPKPVNGLITDIEKITPLSWSPGDNASEHDVYFGIDEFDVADADASTADIYRGRQSDTSYIPPEGYQWGQTYYWRIDEINADATISTGYLWSFTITDYLIVDDFEDYNDYEPDTVWNTWLDGYDDPTNGSSAGYPDPDFFAVDGEHYLEDEIVHGGKWSMPLFYDNSVGLSEVTRTLDSDWAKHGVDTLTLWYHGDAANAPEPMFVALNDIAVVINDDANAALVTEWTRWDIPLQLFTDQGIDLASVNTLTIGFGNKNNPVAGGSGHVFFDDIRLYLPASESQAN